MALIHFNMATFFHNGDPGCTKQNWAESQKPASFAPVKLNVSFIGFAVKQVLVEQANQRIKVTRADPSRPRTRARVACMTPS